MWYTLVMHQMSRGANYAQEGTEGRVRDDLQRTEAARYLKVARVNNHA